ncbi:hypothetical protein HNQ51_000541 [Inhella inkyongensis]|uniref:Uncharacterized protein n=1 Tax=Inhella inkyongensis TaxID=392593 RepID=A0A840S1F8_9BURK|nr:hypothetical protein [Inhella inkyongensis]MBB5203248.1 hypothetical protein [Inhella inkyongensis]
MSTPVPLLLQPTPGPGERLMPNAPHVDLPNGQACVPQHYLQYQQTAESLAALLAEVEFDSHTLLFAAEDARGLYLQVGMVGRENYERGEQQRPHKLVYGRKWRIDADTPTSEVIQTALLAIKKAREHEVRELLTLRDPLSGRRSVPLSNHLDLPLMAAHPELIARQVDEAPGGLQDWLADLEFGQRPIALERAQPWSEGQWLLDLRLGEPPAARRTEGDLAEFDGLRFTLLLAALDRVELSYALMDRLIQISDRQVEERFSFRGLQRFSRTQDPLRIARLSRLTRPYARDLARAEFAPLFQSLNYEVDASRAPQWRDGPLGHRNRAKLARFKHLEGHMPRGYAA